MKKLTEEGWLLEQSGKASKKYRTNLKEHWDSERQREDSGRRRKEGGRKGRGPPKAWLGPSPLLWWPSPWCCSPHTFEAGRGCAMRSDMWKAWTAVTSMLGVTAWVISSKALLPPLWQNKQQFSKWGLLLNLALSSSHEQNLLIPRITWLQWEINGCLKPPRYGGSLLLHYDLVPKHSQKCNLKQMRKGASTFSLTWKPSQLAPSSQRQRPLQKHAETCALEPSQGLLQRLVLWSYSTGIVWRYKSFEKGLKRGRVQIGKVFSLFAAGAENKMQGLMFSDQA